MYVLQISHKSYAPYGKRSLVFDDKLLVFDTVLSARKTHSSIPCERETNVLHFGKKKMRASLRHIHSYT